jgi:hypothetical protein
MTTFWATMMILTLKKPTFCLDPRGGKKKVPGAVKAGNFITFFALLNFFSQKHLKVTPNFSQ